MTEFDYMSKKLPGQSKKMSKALDKSRRDKIIKFIKDKTGKDPVITSGHRSQKHKHTSVNHEMFGAVDIPGDIDSDMLIEAIGEIGGRAIDERKAATQSKSKVKKGDPYRNVVHLDLRAGDPKEIDKMLTALQGRRIKKSFDKPGSVRVEKFIKKGSNNYPLKKDFDESKEPSKKKALKIMRKKFNLKKKKKKKSKYNIKPEQLKKLREESKGKSYRHFAEKLSKFLN